MNLWTIIMDFTEVLVSAGLVAVFIVGGLIQSMKLQEEPARVVVKKEYRNNTTH
ncbi:hypothetical protein [Oribacterium sp. P6A1]|uniref:hypothetical protein n=1 Tax=Oribacterium sp. P6A1 TaxID=1410612 RepID=UPI000A8922AB|nr:hypothetical protein [Oribacterium sp. P6A1]